MSIEEKSWSAPVLKAGTMLGYLHVIENDRGIIGTGLVGWKELFGALKQISYSGWMTIEGFTRDFEGLAGATKVWRDPASSAEDMAAKSLKALKRYERG
jgi:D-psicose/D-tagatose/L-ribulose 3-epimerase